MSVTTNAIIAYGISLDEDQEIPWETGDDTEVEEWWLKVNGYEPPFKMFDEHGMWINGVEPPQEKQDVYWNHRRAALEANPLPVEIVLHCSGDYRMYIVAVPGTVTEAYRGYPVAISVIRPPTEMSKPVMDFCERFGLKGDGPDWWLASLLMK